MAFFPRSSYGGANASFTPLFRLLEDFDSYSRQDQGSRALPQWQPKFDVRETSNAYELHGELPGIAKENVHIDFTEPQTILIRGKTERTYTSGTPPAGFVEDKKVDTAAIEGSDTQSTSHKATVEDEFESVSHETNADVETPGTPKELQETQPAQKKPAEQSKYWLTERSIGEFSRSFNFPTRVDQDTVTANFQDGILTIVVPKAKKHESRRITVN
ncbi:hypothetical protein AK830_g1119 [Neonectria ditissima]|uniref:SHSP domain-containing protein n=1 Tax=Neonectria ditissima TaxID=78410 RepID=A0A0P7BV12_9HYPO|nr:hypothetical protein AK830_g1119 [Neonectria ditissima]